MDSFFPHRTKELQMMFVRFAVEAKIPLTGAWKNKFSSKGLSSDLVKRIGGESEMAKLLTLFDDCFNSYRKNQKRVLVCACSALLMLPMIPMVYFILAKDKKLDIGMRKANDLLADVNASLSGKGLILSLHEDVVASTNTDHQTSYTRIPYLLVMNKA